VVPLLFYHAGNSALPLSVASLLFYINPTTQLLIGVFYLGAAFPPREAVVFGLIWTGLAVYFTTRRGRSAI
jgi:chloramphenicol-sensitive protein RarD